MDVSFRQPIRLPLGAQSGNGGIQLEWRELFARADTVNASMPSTTAENRRVGTVDAMLAMRRLGKHHRAG
jgi:hypothetical protein